MGYYSRYFFPVLPAICALAGVGLAAVVHAITSRVARPSIRGLAAVGGSVAIVAAVALGHPTNLTATGVRANERWISYLTGTLKARHIDVGKLLARVAADRVKPPVLAIASAGAVPYFSKWHTIDIRGLNDARIAATGDHSPEYVLSHDPDVVVVLSRRVNLMEEVNPWGDELYEACLAAGMEVLRTWGTRGYVLIALGHPDREVGSRLRTAEGPGQGVSAEEHARRRAVQVKLAEDSG